jgi:hypothetical protein
MQIDNPRRPSLGSFSRVPVAHHKLQINLPIHNNTATMKFSVSFMAASAVVLCAATATAFVVAPKNAISKSSATSRASRFSTTLSMSQDDFAKSEIDGNTVSAI